MSILCAVDFSTASGLALTAAGRIATTFGQPLTIVTVADPLLAAAERVQFDDDPITLLTTALAGFVDDTLGPGTSSRHQLRVPVGNPAAEILRLADVIEPQLIVIATQGASGVRKFVFGSVADRVLRTSTRPVLVVPPSIEGATLRTLGSMQEVLAPIDFHEYALDDARVALRVARSSHARLRLLHVVAADDADRWTVLRPPVASQLEERMSGARQTQVDRAWEALERVAESLGGTPKPTLEVAQGSIGDQIAHVADRADVDLVVLGLRGTLGVTGARVGAIAYRIVSSSPVPVLALPHEARQGHALAFLDAAASHGDA